ncbi:sensor histidine kinase [Candidatus Woesearchaeota archaeon]|nr:sensor histidine kinase [Candidatus Woesearchaeota archaeon]
MKLHLPNSVWIGNIDPFLKNLDASDERSLEISSHKKWVSVHPVVLAMVAALGLKIINRNKPIRFEKMEATSMHYFERMGLFKVLKLNSGIKIKEHEPSGRFIPIQIIKNSKELDTFITNMIPLLHKEPAKVAPIKYVITELVRNVFEHAYSEVGAVVCAQYYAKSNTVRIGVADVGIGIKKSIGQSYNPRSDLEAISLALTPGVTGTTKKIGGTGENAGAGLFFTKSLAKVNRDFFMIYSGSAMYKLLKNPKNKEVKLIADPLKDHCSYGEQYPYWKGTVVAIDLSLTEQEGFEQVLQIIRDFYRRKRIERLKEHYRRPRFI